MTVTFALTPQQQAILSALVARGEFASIEDAARQLIEQRIAEISAEEGDDMAWAKPYVDEALAELARGEGVSLAEHEARMDALLASMKR